MLPPPSITTWRVSIAILHVIAILFTIFRISDRCRTRRLWWDDYWALFALAFDIILFTTVWVPYGPQQSTERRVILFWLLESTFPCVVWSARISMALSIARLLPPRSTARNLLFAMVGSFGLACITLVAQKVWVCGRNTAWHHSPYVICYVGHTVGIISLCTDVVADSLLVVIPLHMLWRVKLHPSQRRLILSIFAASILTSLAGIVFAAFVFKAQTFGPGRALLLGLTIHIKASVALLVCNLLVVVTYFYRVFRNGEDLEAPETSDEVSNMGTRTVPLTTISFTDISDNNIINTDHSNSRSLASSSKYTGSPIGT